MLTYQIILILISVMGLVVGIHQYKNDSFSLTVFCTWIVAWLMVILVTLFPGITSVIAKVFGLGRGLDAVYIISILFSFYIMFKLYNKTEKQRKRIDELVSQLAIKDHEND